MGQGRHTLRSISDPVYPRVSKGDAESADACTRWLECQVYLPGSRVF